MLKLELKSEVKKMKFEPKKSSAVPTPRWKRSNAKACGKKIGLGKFERPVGSRSNAKPFQRPVGSRSDAPLAGVPTPGQDNSDTV